MLLEIIFGLLAGAGAILPGWNIIQTILVATFMPGSIIYAMVSYFIFKSVTESFLTNSVSGNFYSCQGINSNVSPESLANSLISWKLILLVIGMIVGLLVPFQLANVSGFLSILIALVVMLNAGGKKRNYIGVFGWLVIIIISTKVLTSIGVASPISVIGIAFFGIGQALSSFNINTSTRDAEASPDIVLCLTSTILSLVNAGISPQAITNLWGDGSKMSKWMSSISVETLLEGLALGQLVNGFTLGKSLTGIYISTASLSGGVLIAAVITGIVAVYIAKVFIRLGRSLYSSNELCRGLCVLVSTMTLGLLLGWLAPVVIVIALALHYFVFPALDLTEQDYGLTFIGLII